VSNTSNLSSASPASNVAPPPSSPDVPLVVEDDDEEESLSVLKLLADPTADEGFSTDSSLSPPPPDSKDSEAAKGRGSQFLHPYSQVSMGTTPPSSVPPSSRPSPAPLEGSSQDTTSAVDEKSQRGSGTVAAPRLTRRQRRIMGLPKHGNGSGRATPNPVSASNAAANGNGNIIVIPGGRHPSRLAMKAAQERQRLAAASDRTAVFEEREGEGGGEAFQHEWEKNGAGRKDSRGFVILNI